jgi:hypothetical protein
VRAPQVPGVAHSSFKAPQPLANKCGTSPQGAMVGSVAYFLPTESTAPAQITAFDTTAHTWSVIPIPPTSDIMAMLTGVSMAGVNPTADGGTSCACVPRSFAFFRTQTRTHEATYVFLGVCCGCAVSKELLIGMQTCTHSTRCVACAHGVRARVWAINPFV